MSICLMTQYLSTLISMTALTVVVGMIQWQRIRIMRVSTFTEKHVLICSSATNRALLTMGHVRCLAYTEIKKKMTRFLVSH